MASELRYRFRSEKEFSSLQFDGQFLSVSDAKALLAERAGLQRSRAAELVLTNAHSNMEYRDNAFLIPRNSCLIVRRIPAIHKTPLGNAPQQSHAPTASQHTSGGSNLSAVLPSQRQAQEEAQQRASTSAAADAEDSALNRGEGDVLASMLQSAAEDWQKEQSAAPSFGQGRGRGGGAGRGGGGEGRGFGKSAMPPDPLRKPPRGYVCKRCGIPGHFVQNCPTIGNPEYDRASVKNQPQAAYGVPASRVECTEDGSGALVLPSGQRGNLKPEEETFEAELGFLRDSDPITDKQQEKREVVDNGERKALPAPSSREDGSKSDDNAPGTSSEEQAQNKQQEVEVSQMWAMEHIKSLPSNQQQQLIAAALSMAGHTSQNADESKNTSEDAQQENKRSREEHDSDSTPKKAAKTS